MESHFRDILPGKPRIAQAFLKRNEAEFEALKDDLAPPGQQE